MDFWIAIDEENAAKLIVVIRRFGFDVPELTIDLISQPKKDYSNGITATSNRDRVINQRGRI